MIKADARLIAMILCLALICIPLAYAADCPSGCSCMLATEAKASGYDPCGGKLTQCGFSNYGSTAKYCYATTHPTPAATGGSSGQPDIPYGWFAYKQKWRVEQSTGMNTPEVTIRTDITSEMYNGQRAIHSRSETKGSNLNQITDVYYDPVSFAVLSGTATVTQNGKTQTINIADYYAKASVAASIGSNGRISKSGLDNTMRTAANKAGYSLSITTESVTVPAGTFPSATRYSIFMPNIEGGSTMSYWYYWYSPTYPVQVKEQQTAHDGTIPYTMELTGYKITGSSSSGGPLAGILSGGGGTSGSPSSGGLISTGLPGMNLPGIAPELILQIFGQGLLLLGNGFNAISPLDVNWNAVPGAMSGSMTPAAIGALGAFLGIALGAYTILPDGGFSWSGWPEGGTGPQSDDQAVPTEQVNGPGTDMALFPARGTIDMVDPAYREKVKEWLKNQVYFAGHWYVTDDGKFVASNFMLPDNPTPENTKIPIDELLSVDQFSARVPSDLHMNLAMQAAAQIPLDDLEKLRRGRWSTLPDSEREALLRKLAPIFGAPIHATDTRVDIWKPGLVRPDGGPTAPIPDYVPAQQYKINHGHGNFESHIELNSTNPGWKEDRALNAVIMLAHELKHTQQGSVVDMEGNSPDDISTRNILVRQSYNSAYNPGIDPSRYAGNYIERDAQSYGTNLAAQISKRLRNPATKTAIKALDDLRKNGTGAH